MWNQFSEIVGSSHHRKNQLKPISYYEWYTSWPCFIFRLDTAPISSIVLDRKLGYGVDTLKFQLIPTTDSTVANDLTDENTYWCLTLISDDMTTIDQSGQFRYNNRPDMIEPFSSARPIAEQRAYQIAMSGSLINLLLQLSSMPTNSGSMIQQQNI